MSKHIKTYTAHDDAEVIGLREGRITLLVIPMEPQPKRLALAKYGTWHESRGVWRNTMLLPGQRFKCPYVPGDVIAVHIPGESVLYGDVRLLCRSVEARQVASTDHDTAALVMPLIICDDTEDSYYQVGDIVTDDPLEAFRAEWNRRHPSLPFDKAWGWFVTVEVKK